MDFPSGGDLKSLMSDNMKEKLTVEVNLICSLKPALTTLLCFKPLQCLSCLNFYRKKQF